MPAAARGSGPSLVPYRSQLTGYLRDWYEREKRFLRELDRNPVLDWPEQSRDATRRMVGFFIGEKPVEPGITVTAATPAVAFGTDPP